MSPIFSMEISDERLEAALSFLADTDTQLGELKADVARTEYLAKLHEATAFLSYEGTIDERKSKARVEAQAKWEENFRAIALYEGKRAKRERATILVDLYRTISANRRQGQLGS